MVLQVDVVVRAAWAVAFESNNAVAFGSNDADGNSWPVVFELQGVRHR